MFSLHETTQRRVCRAAFILCAVVPTLATLIFVAYSLHPWRESDWQRLLAQRLHVHATVQQVASPRPGVTRLHQVQLADLRSERPLGSVNEIQVRWRGSRLVMSVDELRIEAGQLSALAATVATWLATDALPPVELRAERMTFTANGRQGLTLTDVTLQSESNKEGIERLGLQAGACRLLVEHKQRTVAVLDTGAGRLPAWLFVDLLPSVSRCGEATFAGSVRIEFDSQTVDGLLRGRLEGVALDQWLGPDSRHRVRGTASVEIDQLSWRGDRLAMVHGRIRAKRGAASRSLLAEAEKRLFCVPDSRLGSLASNVSDEFEPFDELACRFQLSDVGLTIAGECRVVGADAPGCVLSRDGRPLVWEPRYANLPVAQFVQMLSQPAASWLPASAEAHEMAGKLPLPSSRPETKAEVAARLNDSSPH